MPQRSVTVTYLELDPAAFKPRRLDRPDVAFVHVDPPMPELNRFFYAAVGGHWFWLDKRGWTLAQWRARLADPDRIQTWMLTVKGVPAGYVELERQDHGDVEIAYLGLLGAFAGGGMGAHLLSSAVDRAVAMGARKVLVNTCTLDSDRALPNYLARGFVPVRDVTEIRTLPDASPGPWDGA